MHLTKMNPATMSPATGTAISKPLPRKRHAAFTLVELLVVIGIIALLMSILLPALNRARIQSNTVKCLSNLRGIGMAFQMYMQANRGILLPIETIANTGVPQSYWTDILSEQRYLKVGVDDGRNVFVCPAGAQEYPSIDVMYNNYHASRSRFGDPGFFAVPGPTYDTNRADHKAATHYALNGTDWSGTAYNTGRRWNEIFPFTFYRRTDEGYVPRSPNVSKTKNATRVPLAYDGLWMHAMNAKSFLLRHGKTSSKRAADRSCNFVFLDGHAETVLGTRLPGEASEASTGGVDQHLDVRVSFKGSYKYVADGTYPTIKDGLQFTVIRLPEK